MPGLAAHKGLSKVSSKVFHEALMKGLQGCTQVSTFQNLASGAGSWIQEGAGVTWKRYSSRTGASSSLALRLPEAGATGRSLGIQSFMNLYSYVRIPGYLLPVGLPIRGI